MVGKVTVDATDLLPKSRGYYTYQGSLTTPPCSEEVTWMVLTTPVEIAASESAAFGKIHPMNAADPAGQWPRYSGDEVNATAAGSSRGAS